MKKNLTFVLIMVLIFSLCACGNAKTSDNGSTDRDKVAGKKETQGSETKKKTDGNAAVSKKSLSGTYWKATGFSDKTIDTDEYWSDLFLWEDGSGYFRFSQASEDSYYWGYRDCFDCGWTLKNGELILTSLKNPSGELFPGVFEKGRLLLDYDRYFEEGFSIILEQAEMPPFGAQWDVPDLYGTWRMISYTDHNDGTVNSKNGIFSSKNSPFSYVYSELTVYTTMLADYILEPDYSDFGEERKDLSLKRQDGALWDDCPNQAWYVKLVGNREEEKKPLYATYADGKLFLKKKNGAGADSFFESFTAVYERLDVDIEYDQYEWDEWIGDYSFYEYAPPDQNMDYSLSIKKHPEYSSLYAQLEINGFQTETRLQAYIMGNANYIEIIYSSYLTGLMDSPSHRDEFRECEIILALYKKDGEIYTKWGGLPPLRLDNGEPGVYFERV